jgi:membrane-associated protease RseP (regulator of RpoE activity)
MSGTSAFAQSGGGLFGGLFRGRANPGGNGGLGYYPYYGAASGYSATPGYNIYGNYGVYGYPGSRIEGGYGNAGYDPGYGGYPYYDGYGITNPSRTAAPALGSPAVRRRLLGIDEEPVVVAGGVKAMKVGKVYPGTAAERAGLKAGDVIRSVNGYLTEQRGNLAWVIANAAPDNQLKISVQAENDGQPRLITASIP